MVSSVMLFVTVGNKYNSILWVEMQRVTVQFVLGQIHNISVYQACVSVNRHDDIYPGLLQKRRRRSSPKGVPKSVEGPKE